MSLTNINDTVFNAFFSTENNNSDLYTQLDTTVNSEPSFVVKNISEFISDRNVLDIDALYHMLIRVNNDSEEYDYPLYYQDKEPVIILQSETIQSDNKRKHLETDGEDEDENKRLKTEKIVCKKSDISNILYFSELFHLPKIDDSIELEYETGKYTLFEQIMKLKCIKLINETNNEINYGIYIVDLLYPIVFYSGNVARSLKHLKDDSQIIMTENSYNKRAITLRGCLELFSKLKTTRKTRKESVMIYINLVQQIILETFPNLAYSLDSVTECESEYKRTYTSWMKYYNELKHYLNKSNLKSEPFSFPVNFKNKKLVHWCIVQKSNKTKGTLSSKKLKLLESLPGWHWGIYSNINNPKSKLRWNFHFEKLKKYLLSKNIDNLYFDYKEKKKNHGLYKWCILQKMNAKRGLITEEKIEKLNSLQGWHWDCYSA